MFLNFRNRFERGKMDLNTKPDELYIDGSDKWLVHYIMDDDTRINPGDYKEIVQIRKNGTLVGTTTTRKDKNGNNKMPPFVEGVQAVPATAKLQNQKGKK
jgi:hypothetical protein